MQCNPSVGISPLCFLESGEIESERAGEIASCSLLVYDLLGRLMIATAAETYCLCCNDVSVVSFEGA